MNKPSDTTSPVESLRQKLTDDGRTNYPELHIDEILAAFAAYVQANLPEKKKEAMSTSKAYQAVYKDKVLPLPENRNYNKGVADTAKKLLEGLS